jgi:catechol 2,3-dioxygenase-like lactoylglutathione lyase family enzyme
VIALRLTTFGAERGTRLQRERQERVMAVKRIVSNIALPQVDVARSFYGTVLGLEVVMDLGWILTFAAQDARGAPQISIASEGGSGTPVPDLSIEVDNLDEAHQRVVTAGLSIEYGPTQEPWGVTRFYVRDPFGRLVLISWLTRERGT